MNTSARPLLLCSLAASGLLNLRRALTEVAQTLGVARSTVYTYLPEDLA